MSCPMCYLVAQFAARKNNPPDHLLNITKNILINPLTPQFSGQSIQQSTKMSFYQVTYVWIQFLIGLAFIKRQSLLDLMCIFIVSQWSVNALGHLFPGINNNIIARTDMQHSKSFRSASPSPPPGLPPPSTKLLHQRLKKEISLKFSKKARQEETNRSLNQTQRKHNSLLLSNPLTKSSFSLTDAITHKAAAKDALEPVRNAAKSISSKKMIALSHRQKCSSFDEGFFKTGGDLSYKQPPQPQTRKSVSSMQGPKRSFSQVLPVEQQRHNKFKLLLRERNTQYKSASERKICRIDTKINLLRQKRLYLESLLPVEKPKPQIVKQQPKKYPFGQQQFKEKIIKMVNQLIRTIQLYFNMYLHNNIVGGHFRNVEGYSRKIRNILMLDDARAKRITRLEEITPCFQVFKTSGERSQFFMEEDMGLFNALSNFLLKLQKKYEEILEGYNYYENKRRKDEKEAFRKTREKFEKRMGQHEQINRINHFIEHRLRFDQTRREDYMQNLQKRGVVLNLIERSRELILREKQNAIKNALQGQF